MDENNNCFIGLFSSIIQFGRLFSAAEDKQTLKKLQFQKKNSIERYRNLLETVDTDLEKLHVQIRSYMTSIDHISKISFFKEHHKLDVSMIQIKDQGNDLNHLLMIFHDAQCAYPTLNYSYQMTVDELNSYIDIYQEYHQTVLALGEKVLAEMDRRVSKAQSDSEIVMKYVSK